mgnify:CR=1 FL=1
MQAPLDMVSNFIAQGMIESRFDTYLSWRPLAYKPPAWCKTDGSKIKWVYKKALYLKENLRVKDFIKYLKPRCLSPTHTWHKLCNLSFPQLIVLYGKLWEKELLPQHIQAVEELVK